MSKSMTFPEAQPISSITSSTRLGAIIATASSTLEETPGNWYPPARLGILLEIIPIILLTNKTLQMK